MISMDIPITVTEIREQLSKNPPGQGAMGMEIDFMYMAPFYISFLLDVLEAPARRRKKLLSGGLPREPYIERTKAAGWVKVER
jgi:hypothetical protein